MLSVGGLRLESTPATVVKLVSDVMLKQNLDQCQQLLLVVRLQMSGTQASGVMWSHAGIVGKKLAGHEDFRPPMDRPK